MSYLFARVELHNATRWDYARLHLNMECSGFFREITDREGVRYHLSTGMYVYQGSATDEQAHDMARAAAAAVEPNPEVMVWRTENAVFSGLRKVQPVLPRSQPATTLGSLYGALGGSYQPLLPSYRPASSLYQALLGLNGQP